MTNYVTGAAIRALREKRGYTQRELAEKLADSDKAIDAGDNLIPVNFIYIGFYSGIQAENNKPQF